MTLRELLTAAVTSDTDVSSKRLISLFSMAMLAIVIVINLCGVPVQDIVYYTLSGLVLGASAMTLMQNKNTT